jgi:hypothetical protein
LLPDPPAYRRATEPARDKSLARLPDAEALLARAQILLKAASGSNLEPAARAIVEGLEGQLRALAAIAQGQIRAAEDLVDAARIKARAVDEMSSAFHRVAEPVRPVFNPTTGESRYDPHETEHLEVTLPCPNNPCRKPALYSISTQAPTHRFKCSTCGLAFFGYFGEVQALEQQTVGRVTRYAMRVEEVGGRTRAVEFDDLGNTHLPVAPHDLVALLYNAGSVLAAVENLSTGRVMWVQPRSSCFLATAVYGPNGPELEVFRDFRDRRMFHSWWGVRGVVVYYRWGPLMSRWVVRRPLPRRILRAMFERVRHQLELEGRS